MYWSEIWDFVKRHILAIVIMAIVAVAYPWTLIIIVPLVFVIMNIKLMQWRLNRIYRNANPNANHKNKGGNKQGKVTVIRTERPEQRINDNVGEYVDFKEIKEEETQK